MKIVVADHSGFCFGVERAISTTFSKLSDNNSKKSIYTLGPLIHNQQVVDELQAYGVKVADNLDHITDNSIVIIRSHGVPKHIYDLAGEKKVDIMDATCPFVRKIQNIVKEYSEKGYHIAIIGDSEHPEVKGINGWCNNKAYIIKTKNDIDRIPFVDKLCIVVQTTMPIELYNELSPMLERKAEEIVKFNTICSATKHRQQAAQDLAKDVDAIIVIGGYHSSNTLKLVEICRNEKPNATFHIETADQLPINELRNYEVVGVTAGASTPKWIIDKVVEKLQKL